MPFQILHLIIFYQGSRNGAQGNYLLNAKYLNTTRIEVIIENES